MAIRTVLIEDNETIRANLIPAMAELGGIEILGIAGSESQAVEMLARHANLWQLVVVDLFLAQGSGIGVLRALRTRRPAQIALVLTNYATDEIRRRCLELGADGVFDKSTELEAFFAGCAVI